MLKKMLGMSCLLLGLNLATSGTAAEIIGQSIGNGGDEDPATFHFNPANTDFQMLDKNGNPLTRENVALIYQDGYRIFVNGQDLVGELSLTLEGADLSASNWTNASYPAAGKLAIDPLSGRFKFHTATWADPKQIDVSASTNDFSAPQLAINNQGIGFCTFCETSVYYSQVARFQSDLGWEPPQRVDAVIGGPQPKIAVNDSGEAMCVYLRSDYNIYANRYVPGSGWQGETLVCNPASTAMVPTLALANNGHAVVTYNQMISGDFHSTTNDFNPNTLTWNTDPIQIDSMVNTLSVISNTTQLAMSQITGEAICVFTQAIGDGAAVYANHYQPGASAWIGARWIGPRSGSDPALAMNSQGDAICVYCYKPGSVQMVYATYYEPGIGWQGMDQIAIGNTSSAFSLRVSIDRQGNAICVMNDTKNYPNRILASFHQPGQAWQSLMPINNLNGENALIQKFDMNENGLAVCCFIQKATSGGLTRGYVNTFTQTDGWLGPVLVDANNGYSVESSALALNDQGLILKVEAQPNGTSNRIFAHAQKQELPGGNIQVNYFAAAAATTPTPTATITMAPAQTAVQISGRKIFPRLGEKCRISLDLNRAGQVTIVVYNLAGEKVKTLVDSYYEAGTHSILWSAENLAGEMVASGVYVLHIQLPQVSRTEKVVVIK